MALGKESAEAGSKLKVPEMLFGFTSQIVGRRHGTSVTIPSAILAKSMPSERTMVASAITGVGAAGVKMPHGDVASLRKGIAKDYRDLDDDPRFGSIISHLPRTLGWGEATSGKHYYLYVAPGAEKHRDAPLVIFLHGFGGNFKIYPWWLKSWADRNGWVVVYPTFGMGRWEKPGGAEVVRKVYGDVKGRIPGIDKRPVIFMGLSQGAIGLARVTTGAKIPFKGVAFISGASPTRYLRNIKGKHALVVIG
ncbi:MAG: hypothetical protein QF662_00175, partial [Phycisphaerae bacterium]|nr:hypothetical protein [Phycisphaerae bacterium]